MPKRLTFLLGLLGLVLAAGLARWLTLPQRGPGYPYASEALRRFEQGGLPEAETGFLRAILAEPGNGEYYAGLGEVFLRQGRFDRAAGALQTAAYLAPGYPHVYCELAQALVEEGRRSEALDALAVALRKTPDCSLALSVQGEQLLRDDNLSQALAAFQKVIRLAPTFVLAYEKAGYILLATNQLDEAQEVLLRGLNAGPQSPGIHALLGEIASRRASDPQAFQLAETHFRVAAANNPEAAKMHAALGKLYLRKGDLEAARREYQQALVMQPALGDALYGMLQVAGREGRASEARFFRTRYEEVQALDRRIGELKTQALARPEDVGRRLKLARLCMENGILAEAARSLNEAVRLDPALREARALRAELYRLQGQEERARREEAVAVRLPRAGQS